MLRKAVAATALCALTTNAILLPPGISLEGDADGLVPVHDPLRQHIEIPCRECAFSADDQSANEDVEESDDLFWIQTDAENKLLLDFSISEDGQQLLLHGDAIYPPHVLDQGSHIYVDQVSSSISTLDAVSGKESIVPLEVSSYRLEIDAQPAATPNGEHEREDSITRLRLAIMTLEQESVDLDDIDIDLLSTADGQLLMLRVDSVPSPSMMPFRPPSGLRPPPPVPHFDGAEDCGQLPLPLCKFKKMVEAKLSAMRHSQSGMSPPCPGAHGRHGHSFPSPPPPEAMDMDFDGQPPHFLEGPPPFERPFGRHHHHHHKRPSIAKGVIAILIPVMAGITVGLLVSLLGLMVGRLVCWSWYRLTGAILPESRTDFFDSRHAEEGKLLLSEDVEPLPLYEEAPPYEIHEHEHK